MKRQIRKSVFETNSSSVHSLTMCSGEEFDKWDNGEIYYWRYGDKFGTKEQIIEEMKKMTLHDGSPQYVRTEEEWNDEDIINGIFSDNEVKTCDEYFENEEYECFSYTYTTPLGERVVAFGYYGHD